MKAPHLIHRDAAYDIPAATAAVGVKETTLRREARLGRLRVSRRGGKYFILGIWLLQWLRAGEVKRKSVPVKSEASSN